MGKLGELTEIRSKPGCRRAVLEILEGIVDDIVNTEPGTETAVFHSSIDDDVTVWIYVLFSNEEARVIHRSKTEIRGRMAEQLAPLTEGPSKQMVFNVEFGKLPGRSG